MHGHCCTPPYSRWSCTCLKACSCLAAGSARVSPLSQQRRRVEYRLSGILTFCRLAGVLGNGQLLSAVPLHDTVYRAHTYSYRSRPFTCARIVASRKPLMKLCSSAMQAPGDTLYASIVYHVIRDPQRPARAGARGSEHLAVAAPRARARGARRPQRLLRGFDVDAADDRCAL